MAWACSNMWPPGEKSVPNRILSGFTSWRREATMPADRLRLPGRNTSSSLGHHAIGHLLLVAGRVTRNAPCEERHGAAGVRPDPANIGEVRGVSAETDIRD